MTHSICKGGTHQKHASYCNVGIVNLLAAKPFVVPEGLAERLHLLAECRNLCWGVLADLGAEDCKHSSFVQQATHGWQLTFLITSSFTRL